jgi:hypothetical protein
MRRVFAAFIAAAALSTFAVQGTAVAAARAHPSGCKIGSNNVNGSFAKCDRSNGGKYKATVLCLPVDGGGPIHREAGVSKTSGYSVVSCPPRTTYMESGLLTRP